MRYARDPGGPATPPIPNRLRELRRARGLTLTDVAERVGIFPGTLRRIEDYNGRFARNASDEMRRKLAAFYGLRVSDVFDVDAEPEEVART